MNNKPLAAGFLALALLLASTAFAASTWEGSAVVSTTMDFPGEGLFGACNSFPLNSTVEVENLETGKKVGILITKNVDNPAIFMALSPKAAAELGMKNGSSARVRVLAPSGAASTLAPSSPAKASESTDPDYNPRLLATIKPVPTSPAGSDTSKDFMSLLGAGASPKPETPAPAAPEATVPEAALSVAPAAPASLPENPPEGLASPLATAPSTDLASPAVLSPESPTAVSLPPPATSGSAGKDLALPAVASEEPTESLPPQVSESRALPEAASPVILPSLPEALAKEETATAATPAPTAEPALAVAETGIPVAVEPRLESLDEMTIPEALSFESAVSLADPEPPLAAGGPPPSLPGLSEAPAKAPETDAKIATLPEPGLGPDILPEAVLERLAQPLTPSPSVALADCEVIMPAKPEAVATEVAKPAAADSIVALVPTEPRPPEKTLAPLPQAGPATPPPAMAAEAIPAPAAAPLPSKPIAQAQAALKAPAAVQAPAASASSSALGPAREPADLVRLDGMKKGSWYVQIGLYGSEEGLRGAIKSVSKNFPLLYEAVVDAKGLARYRLYVGPLGRDEGGFILTRIKSLGFKDAVLKKG